MSEENKALVRRFVDEFQTAGKAEVANELAASDLIHHSGPAWAHAATVGLHVLQSLFHVECSGVACSVTAWYAAGVTVSSGSGAAAAGGAGVQRGAAVARSWIL